MSSKCRDARREEGWRCTNFRQGGVEQGGVAKMDKRRFCADTQASDTGQSTESRLLNVLQSVAG